MTLQINFDNPPAPVIPIHAKENNTESQGHRDANEYHFSDKCLLLLKRLCNGERLKFADEVKTIGDLRRRSLDLIEAGIPVHRKFKERNEEEKARKMVAIKEYFIDESDIPAIKDKYREILSR